MKHIIPPPIDLLAVIEAHCAKAGMSKTSFGTDAVGDPRFVADLAAGRECRRKTVLRVLDFVRTGKAYRDQKAAAK